MKGVFLVLVLLMSVGSAQGQWQMAGFSGQNVECIAQHPQDTSIILVSMADSLFQSTDGGHSWSLFAHFNGLPINYLMYDQAHYDTVYALAGWGTYSDGIYRSTDGGNNWAVLEWFLCPRCMTIPGWPASFMLVGLDSTGIFKTEDGGSTWTPWNDGLTDLCIHSLSFCNPFDSFPIFFAGTAHGLFYRSYDNWIQAIGIPTDQRVAAISYHPSQEIGFAAVTGSMWADGIYRSTDYGLNWQDVEWWVDPSCVVLNPLWPYYPDDTCSVFIGDSGLGVKYSADCGDTWQQANNGLGNLYINRLSFHPLDSMRLFAATQGGLYRYQYGPGIAESEVDEIRALPIRLQTVQRTGMPIPLQLSVPDDIGVLSYSLRIYDVAGRQERFLVLNNSSVVLSPIRVKGVYFLTVNYQNKLHKKKIVVVD